MTRVTSILIGVLSLVCIATTSVAADKLKKLDCTTDQIARFDGGTWVCSSAVTQNEIDIANVSSAVTQNEIDIGNVSSRVTQNESDIANAAGAKRVFITSQTFTGNLGGWEGADSICQDAADNAFMPLGGKWKAWIAGGNRRDVTIAGRFSRHSSLYVLARPESVLFDLIADPIYGEFPHKLFSSISSDENGNHVGFGVGNVWTNTSTLPTVGAPQQSCRDPGQGNLAWTSNQAGVFGHTGTVQITPNEVWQDAVDVTCDQLNHLYCFEQ